MSYPNFFRYFLNNYVPGQGILLSIVLPTGGLLYDWNLIERWVSKCCLAKRLELQSERIKDDLICYLYGMNVSPVNIDFKLLSLALQKYIRQKAIQSNSTILYKKGDKLIEENPKTSTIKILKEYIHS